MTRVCSHPEEKRKERKRRQENELQLRRLGRRRDDGAPDVNGLEVLIYFSLSLSLHLLLSCSSLLFLGLVLFIIPILVTVSSDSTGWSQFHHLPSYPTVTFKNYRRCPKSRCLSYCSEISKKSPPTFFLPMYHWWIFFLRERNFYLSCTKIHSTALLQCF